MSLRLRTEEETSQSNEESGETAGLIGLPHQGSPAPALGPFIYDVHRVSKADEGSDEEGECVRNRGKHEFRNF